VAPMLFAMGIEDMGATTRVYLGLK
jgi:hypothetical protein